MRLVLLGCGGVVEDFHVPALRNFESQVEVVGLVDVNEDRRSRIKSLLNIANPIETDSIKDFPLGEVDLGIIATPAALHFEQAKYLLSRGTAVLLEKPPVVKPDNWRELERMAAESKLPLCVVHNYLYRPIFKRMFEVIEGGQIGTPLMFRINQYDPGCWPGIGGPEPLWRNQRKLAGGGCLLDNGYHYLYILRQFDRSKITEVKSFIKVVDQDGDVEDLALVLFSLDSGLTVALEVLWCCPGGGTQVIELYGDQGSIGVDEDNSSLRIFCSSSRVWEDLLCEDDCDHYNTVYNEVLSLLEEREESSNFAPQSCLVQQVLEDLQFIYESSLSQ